MSSRGGLIVAGGFDPFPGTRASGVNRGVVYWEAGRDRRIVYSAGSFLHAVDADTGRPIESFGRRGRVDLREGLLRDPETLRVSATSPGIVFRDLLIQGSTVSDGWDGAPGHIRAYDIRTGEIAWTFHTIPQPGEYGHESWPAGAHLKAGGANCWGGMSLDVKRGIVYVPTGSASYDFYGGERHGKNLFANCLLALDAASGRLIWYYQMVHRDLWDYDIPAPPNLLTVRRDGRIVDAVAQVTKKGFVFVFDRETGEPLFPIEERPVKASDLPGEAAWPTQPFPLKPRPFVRQELTEDEITDLSPEAEKYVREKIRGARLGPIFTPPSREGTVLFPGTRGGANWGGAAVDPNKGILFVNANELPMLIRMRDMPGLEQPNSPAALGERVYSAYNCNACHGADRAGAGIFPSLLNLAPTRSTDEVVSLLRTGKGDMPPYPNIVGAELTALLAYLFEEAREATPKIADFERPASENRRFLHDGWNELNDQNGYPGIKPPWGTLNAIDLNSGEFVWTVPLGEYPELMARGLPPTGTQNLGGPAVTAGGLVFIGATRDEYFRAFDADTGKVLWRHRLPARGSGNPTVYESDGRQFIVIAAGGGGKVGTRSGDAFVAFSLPPGGSDSSP